MATENSTFRFVQLQLCTPGALARFRTDWDLRQHFYDECFGSLDNENAGLKGCRYGHRIALKQAIEDAIDQFRSYQRRQHIRSFLQRSRETDTDDRSLSREYLHSLVGSETRMCHGQTRAYRKARPPAPNRQAPLSYRLLSRQAPSAF